MSDQTVIKSGKDLSDNQSITVSSSPSLQDKVADQALANAGGVGLGIILTIVGVLFIVQWLGLKDAIAEWIKNQSSQARLLQSLSESLEKLIRDVQQDHIRHVEVTADFTNKIDNIDSKLVDLKGEIKEVQHEVNNLRDRTISNK